MIPIANLNIQWYHYLFLILISAAVFGLSYWSYPHVIKWMKKKKYVGYDIHKGNRPETAESGGLVFSITIIFGLILVGFVFPRLWNEILVFIITVIIAALIGWIDDRKQLSSFKKMLLMFMTGIPIFISNLPFFGWISVANPILPILGKLQLNIIYPILIPFIIMIMTNTVNMLEGYNGEGSGTSSLAIAFMIITSLILGSSQGLIYGLIVLAGIGAFYFFNRFPAKIFPGDIGTLVIGAAIALVGIFGSIEVIMILVMLPQIFNSFYVIASVRGFKESHDITKKDIWIDENDLINAIDDHQSSITLPRLLVASGPLSEKELVHHIMGLTVISGIFSLIVALIMIPFYGSSNIFITIGVSAVSLLMFIFIILKFPKIVGLVIIMMILLTIASLFLIIIDQWIIDTPANWFFGGLIGIVILILWYLITIQYFWMTFNRHKKIKKEL